MSMRPWWGRAACAPALVCVFLALPAAAQGRIPRGRPVRVPVVRHVPLEYPTIQGAIDAARDGDVVVVRRGTYTGTLDFRGKAVEVVGWDGADVTVLQGAPEGAIVRFHHGEGPDSRLIGFTIRRGLGGFDDSAGGVSGMHPESGLRARATLSDCVIEDCITDQDFSLGPAGVSGNLLLERCRLRRNESFNYLEAGGGTGAFTLIQCVIEENFGCGGGGLRLQSGAHVLDCVFRANQAGPCATRAGPFPTHGGAIHVDGTGVVIEGSILVENRVAEGPEPGGFGCSSLSRAGALFGEALLERCTIVGNHWVECATLGGLVGAPVLRDCIVYDNADPAGAYLARDFRYSDVQGGAAGAGSFDAFPALVERAPGDLRLSPGSPCIDRGDPASPLDPDGTRADIGARHHPQGTPALGVAYREHAPIRPDPEPAFGYGTAVAADGDTLLVNAPLEQGSVQVLRHEGDEWVATQRLESGELFDLFGYTLAIEGDIAAVGAVEADSIGAVHVFERPGPNAPFVHTLRLQGPPFHFGSALALSGGFLAIGADVDGLGRGAAFLYHRVTRGKWELAARFSAPETQGWLDSQFGSALDLEGDTLVVGAPMMGAESYPGAAFVYQRSGRAPQAWTLVRALAPSVPADQDRFGQAVDISGDTILVSTRSGVEAFERRGPGLPWSQVQKLVPAGGLLGAGADVVLVGNRAWLARGAGLQFDPAVWEFARANAGAPWVEVTRINLLPLAVPAPLAPAFSEGTLFLGGLTRGGNLGEVRRLTRGPELATLALDQAADAETIVLTGRGLAAVTRVLVDGAEVPIVGQTDERMVLAPERREPGFATLALESPEGDLALPRAWHAAPTLAASADGLGGRLEVELENGAPGVYALLWSLDLRARPLHVASPPTWHALQLDFLPGRSGQLALGAFDAEGRATRAFDLPADPALLGLTLHLQAWCRRGLLFPTGHSFSNTASLGL